MTYEEILKEAFEKVVKNGFTNYGYSLWSSFDEDFKIELVKEYFWKDRYYAVIFSHDFAKAFWGNEETWVDGNRLPKWEAELMIMVRYEEPLKYLEKFLK